MANTENFELKFGDLIEMMEANLNEIDKLPNFEQKLKKIFETENEVKMEENKGFFIWAIERLSKRRIKMPMRGKFCTHFQAFDGYKHLEMCTKRMCFNCPQCIYPICDDLPSRYNQFFKALKLKRKIYNSVAEMLADKVVIPEDAWTYCPRKCSRCNATKCPICGKPANMDQLYIDRQFEEWMKQVPENCDGFYIQPDGSIVPGDRKNLKRALNEIDDSSDEGDFNFTNRYNNNQSANNDNETDKKGDFLIY